VNTQSSLSMLHERVREAARAQDERALRTLLGVLRSDGRVGARVLLESAARRFQGIRAERLRFERLFERARALRRAGAKLVAGVDEVGVGPLAGPLVAAAVVLPDPVELPGLNDSKRLSSSQREKLAAAIQRQALALAVAEVWPPEIDMLNVYRASLEAMRRAVLALPLVPDHVLVDARSIPALPMPQTAIQGGDASEGAIAAASIVAKVHRDTIMRRTEGIYPGYGFTRHVGYGTRAHLAALDRLGPCPLHRRSFAPVAQRVAGARGGL